MICSHNELSICSESNFHYNGVIFKSSLGESISLSLVNKVASFSLVLSLYSPGSILDLFLSQFAMLLGFSGNVSLSEPHSAVFFCQISALFNVILFRAFNRQIR